MDPSPEHVRLSRSGLYACGGTHADDEECFAGEPLNAGEMLAGAMARACCTAYFPTTACVVHSSRRRVGQGCRPRSRRLRL